MVGGAQGGEAGGGGAAGEVGDSGLARERRGRGHTAVSGGSGSGPCGGRCVQAMASSELHGGDGQRA